MPTNTLWQGQDILLNDTKYKEHAIVSGVGYGKTHFGVRWFHRRCLWNKNSKKSLIVSAKNDLLINAILPLYEEYLEELGWIKGQHYQVKSPRANPELTYFWGHTILFRSAEKTAAKKIVSYNISHAWVDEPGLCSESTPIEITKRSRDPKAAITQVCYTGTPEEMNFFYRKFGSQAVERINDRFSKNENSLVLHGKTYDNLTLKQDYLDFLLREFAWNDNLRRAYIEGEFVPIFDFRGYDFDPKKHLIDFGPLKKDRPIYLTFDFNVTTGRAGGTSWVACQEDGNTLIAVDENKGSSRTVMEAIDNFCKQCSPIEYAHIPIRIDGDASGYGRNAGYYGHPYEIIQNRLIEKGFLNVKVIAKRANPAVDARLAATNRLFSGEYNKQLKVDRKCNKLSDSLSMTTIDDTGRIKKPAGEQHTHLADAFSYRAYNFAPMERPRNHRNAMTYL